MVDSTLDDVSEVHWAAKRRAQPCGPLPRRRMRPASGAFRPNAPAALEALSDLPMAAANDERPGALRSQWVGRFSVAAGLGAIPAIVRKGHKLGSVRALGIEWPVLAPAAGVVLGLLAEDASVVEYGQVLVDFAAAV